MKKMLNSNSNENPTAMKDDREVTLGGMEDSGERRNAKSGAVRDRASGKGRYDLISFFALNRILQWTKESPDCDYSVMDPWKRIYKHITKFMLGNDVESNIAAAAFYAIRMVDLQEDSSKEKGLDFADYITGPTIMRLARWYELGSIKYDDRNWEKGMPWSWYIDSATRHLIRHCLGECGEDHAVAVLWNLMAILHFMVLDRYDLNDLPHREPTVEDGGDS